MSTTNRLSTTIGARVKSNTFLFIGIAGGMLLVLWILTETLKANNSGFLDKTLWDWLELLIIPGVLAIGVWWLNRVEKRTELKIAEDRLQAERKIANTRLQEETLQAYLDRMTSLLIDSKLRESDSGDEVRSIARSRTLTVVRSLDGIRKGLLLRFLYESELIVREKSVIALRGAELDYSELEKANLRWSNLSWSSLKRAYLVRSLLHGADLTGAQLGEANLKGARLVGATLRMATLSGATLTEADLSSADLQDANLADATLCCGVLVKANLRGANLSGCDLSNSDLRGADLTRVLLDNSKLNGSKLEGAILIGASLKNADLTDACFDNADLSLVNLTGAKIDIQQLTNVRSLVVAIMPDGSEI